MSDEIVYEHGNQFFNGVLWNEIRNPDKEGMFKATLLVNIHNTLHLVICEKHNTESIYKEGLMVPFSIEHAHAFFETYLDYLAACSPYQAQIFKNNCLTLLETHP